MSESVVLVIACILLVISFILSREITIKIDIPEIKIKSDSPVEMVPIEDLYDEKGELKDKEVKDTIDDVLARVNEIMYGEDIIDRGDK